MKNRTKFLLFLFSCFVILAFFSFTPEASAQYYLCSYTCYNGPTKHSCGNTCPESGSCPCYFGNPWTQYKVDLYWGGNYYCVAAKATCSHTDKCISGERGLRPGYCTYCGAYGPLYKWCCGGAGNTVSDYCKAYYQQDPYYPNEGVCPRNTLWSPCPTACTNECSYSGQIQYGCSGSWTTYRVCGNYDADPCLEWSGWVNWYDCGTSYYQYQTTCSADGRYVYYQYRLVSKGCSGGSCYTSYGSWTTYSTTDCGNSYYQYQTICSANGRYVYYQYRLVSKGCSGGSCYTNYGSWTTYSTTDCGTSYYQYQTTCSANGRYIYYQQRLVSKGCSGGSCYTNYGSWTTYSTTDCGTSYYEYRCSGDYVQRRYVSKGCSGGSCYTNYGSWSNWENCAAQGKICDPGTATCVSPPLFPPAAPTNLSATDGTYPDKVVVTWTKSSGATNYDVFDGSNWHNNVGDVNLWTDYSAPAPTINPGNTIASDNYSDKVSLGLSGTSVSNGVTRSYKARAKNIAGTSPDSNSDTGYRGVGSLTYQWQRSAGDNNSNYSDIIGATSSTYNDTNAPAPTITPGTSSASDGTYTDRVSLSLSGQSANNGEGRYYRCILSAVGASQQISNPARGYRGVGSLTHQWQRSAGDSDSNYSNLSGATSASYNDFGAPADGSGRYYKSVLNASGAAQQISSPDRGFRGAAPSISADFSCSLDGTNWQSCTGISVDQGDTVYFKDDATVPNHSAPLGLISSREWQKRYNGSIEILSSDNEQSISTILSSNPTDIWLIINGGEDARVYSFGVIPMPEWHEVSPF